jgi:hypothetical protein
MVRDAMQQEGVRVRPPFVAATASTGASKNSLSDQVLDGKDGKQLLAHAATFPNPSAFRISGSQGVVFDGPTTLSGNGIPAEADGVRFMWYPGKAALRAGRAFTDRAWNDENIGEYSVATGIGTTAKGEQSTALGYFTEAIGIRSTAMGARTNAIGGVSTAMGTATTALGSLSTAMGFNTTAGSYLEVVMGRYETFYDVSESGATQWNDADRLFVIGNGSGVLNDPDYRTDALVILKSGDTTLNGKLAQSSGGNGANLTLTQKNTGNFARLRLQQDGEADFWDVAGGGSNNRLNLFLKNVGNLMTLHSDCPAPYGDGGTGDNLVTFINGAGVTCDGKWFDAPAPAEAHAANTMQTATELAAIKAENAVLRGTLEANQDRIARLEAALQAMQGTQAVALR